MRKLCLTLATGAIVLSASAGAQNSKGTLDAAARAMGAINLKSIEYSGAGFTYGFAQAPGPGEPWPLFIAKSYSVAVDYETPALRQEVIRLQGERPPRGGLGQPIAGEARSVQTTTPASPPERALQLWLTPHGIIKAATANAARVNGRTLEFSIDGQTVMVTLDNDSLVARVEYMVGNPVLGDMPIELTYSGYRDYGGVKFPTRIVEKTDGYPTLDISIREVRPNAAVSVPPAAAPSRPPAPPAVQTQEIAKGVWHLIASNYGSYAVEFTDHIVMFEGPLDDARSVAVNDFVRKTVANKPIRYLVNTHTHFDHAGGVRSYVADGVTIIAHEMNKAYLEKVWGRPRTIRPDRLARLPKAPVWEAMTEKKVLSDGARTLELHQIKDNGHFPYILMGYLPAERILLYGDMYNPPAGSDPRDLARTNEYASNLYENIQRLGLDVALIAPVHGRPVPLDNLKKAIGLLPLSQ
jgi:glyoxylase-like metal-dependent hydrolase (beta-lactamase superfamily II)